MSFAVNITLCGMNRVGDTLIHTGSNRALIEMFASVGVEFLLIGGLATAWYCLDRQADDMDLLVNPSTENSARIARALTKLGISGFSPESFTRLGLQVPLKQTLYAELLTPEPSAKSYAEMAAMASEASLFETPIRVASIQTLIYLKERAIAVAGADTKKHVEDVRVLRLHSA